MNIKKHAQSNNRYILSPFSMAIILTFVCLLSFGYFIYIMLFDKNSKGANGIQASNATQQADLIEVDVIEIKKQNTVFKQKFPAKVLPMKISPIRPQIDGVIIKQFFREGSYVKRGYPLYQVDYAEKIIIRAPISGIIGRTYQTVGSLVTQNQAQPLAYITQPSPIYVDVSLPYSNFMDILRLKNSSFGDVLPSKPSIKIIKNKTKISEKNLKYLDENYEDINELNEVNELSDVIDIASYKERFMSSSLNDFEISIDDGRENIIEKTRPNNVEIISEDGDNSIVMRSIFANKNHNLISGTFVDVALGVALKDAILVPHRASYILPSGKLYVWIVDGGFAKKKAFEASQSIGNKWIVESGISDGDHIVYAGMQKITEGSRVKESVVVPVDGDY